MAKFHNVRGRLLLSLLFLFGMVAYPMKTSASFSSKVRNGDIRCIEKEREALLHIHPSCSNNFTRSHRDCCNWPGVHCSNLTGRIYGLYLDEFLLGCDVNVAYEESEAQIHLGSLVSLEDLVYLDFVILDDFGFVIDETPTFLGSFPKLRNLTICFSWLSGVIPPQLGNLTRLESLEICRFQSLKTKNLKWLSRLTSLKRLVFPGNDLSEATDWIHAVNNLPSLEYLDLSECSLPNFYSFSSVNSSKSLAFIDLSGNDLQASSVWTWIFNHSSLVQVHLSSNLLSGSIPDRFRSLTSLSHLDLSFNQLKGGLGFMEDICGLQRLDVSHNYLTGDLSTIFQSLSCAKESLVLVSLHANRFSGSVPDFTRLSSLRELNLDHNSLDGSLPLRFEQSSNLAVLNLQENQLTGSVPDLSVFMSLKVLQLQKNHLSGTVHKGLGQLSRLERLDFSSNSLKGEIGISHLSNLSSLRYLDMSFNSLTVNLSSSWVPPFRLDTIGLASCKLGPRFPEWLRTQQFYSMLDMSNAGISDTIPLWFWNLSFVANIIGLSHNELHGTLPNSSFMLSRFPALDLSYNLLEGTVPSFFLNAQYLNLSRNSFSGSISFLCPTTYMLGVDLSHNFFSGKLPDCNRSMDYPLTLVLDLSNNNLSGELPSSFGNLKYLRSLHLSDNKFSGKLPLFLGNFTGLMDLDLGNNLFSGEIPKWIWHNLPNLTVLSLRNNSFSGNIPPQICHLSSLQILDLSINNISGVIPNCLCYLTAMTPKENAPMLIPDSNGTFSSIGSEYKDHISLVVKGFTYEYKNFLQLMKTIDLSSNKLQGIIPDEVSCLSGLVSLNLSRNNLDGSITSKIGELKSLESLDLSENHLSGNIPPSLSNLNSLGTLNMANNKLSGRIPKGTQIQGFNASVFEGNPGLCGDPLPKKCPGDGGGDGGGGGGGGGSGGAKGDDGDEKLGLYISIALGFITGFWGVCGVLVLRKSWRRAFYSFWIHVYDRLYVIVALRMALIRRRFRV